jgi:tetratricopeptide (TPR) repeat protein
MWKLFTSTLVCTLVVGCSVLPGAPDPDTGARSMDARGQLAAEPVPDISPDVERQYQNALRLIRDSNRDAARQLLVEITRAQPELAGPWTNLGRLYAQDEDWDAARAAFSQAIAANPSNCAAHNEYGVLLRKLGEFNAALAQYQACLAIAPDHADAYYNLGILYELYLGRLEDALAAYRHYLELSPNPENKVKIWVTDLERRLDS